jgi:deazaflavin-dependent oxidoreductase (nitroreductase family)
VAQTYRLGFIRGLVNRIVKLLVRLGLGGRHTYVLRVRGRKTGRCYATPVRLVEGERGRWLVAPYGERAWTKNARASGAIKLSRGGRTERVRIAPASPEESAPILRDYVRSVPVVRPFFDVKPDSPLDAFVAEAPRHPVFRILGPEPE